MSTQIVSEGPDENGDRSNIFGVVSIVIVVLETIMLIVKLL